LASTIKLPVPASLAWLAKRESAALDERTPGSAEMFRRAGQVLAGGVWPIYLMRGEGQRVWDVDGNELFAFHNGFSSMLLGHAPPAIGAAVSGRYGHGTHFAAPTEDAVVVAEELSRRWGLPRWRFTNSGTESVMGAIRIARGLSGRTGVVKIFGSYLTATMSVGRIFDGAVAAAVAADPSVGVDHMVIPVVAECDDSWLNDARVVQVEADDAGRARRKLALGSPRGPWAPARA
jgi:glutamate-1-semialdehyde aminotransferase